MDEKEFLDEAAKHYKTFTSPISKWAIESYIKKYQEGIVDKGKSLELGCSSGYSTKLLLGMVEELVVVDGSRYMLEKIDAELKSKKNVSFVYSLFEELEDENEYYNIFCSYVLEHVANPVLILNTLYRALKPGGKLFITVPNATALSRQMALEMGIIKDLYELTENDMAHGHRRIFDMGKLKDLIAETPFKIQKTGGTFVKEFADFQLNQMIETKIIGEEQLYGMQKLAEKYPEISGSIYAICVK